MTQPNTKSALVTVVCLVGAFVIYAILSRFAGLPFSTFGGIVAAVVGLGVGIFLDRRVFAD